MTDAAQNKRPKFKKPVAWLLGRDLIASLQGTLLYTAFGSKLDPREWMRAKVNSFRTAAKTGKTGEQEFWFDYIADTGDGMKATYSIAYLSLSNLYVRNLLREIPAEASDLTVRLENLEESAEIYRTYPEKLPRGAFLLVGGDTSYHLSDYATLGSRFYQPFKWAFEDLWQQLAVAGRTKELDDLAKRRPIFGIPGNHDYYDQLDGFRRQFLHPSKPEIDGSYRANMPDEDDTEVPQLMLPGFCRLQESSYVALELPFGWSLWGLDTEVGLIDEHQQHFFDDVKETLYAEALEMWNDLSEAKKAEMPAPKLEDFPRKLIMATCSPTTSFGRFAREDDKKSAESVAQLKLSQPFMPNEGSGNIASRSGDAKLENGQCRLDLSGDYHFYARYWGPQSKQAKPRQSDVEQPDSRSYASVISGLGGAFHHPSQTFFGDLQEQVLYPPENVSRQIFSGKLFNFRSIFKGGGIGIIGFVLAFTIYFTATVPQSGREIIQNAFAQLKLAQPIEIKPTVLSSVSESVTKTNPAVPHYYIQQDSESRPAEYFWVVMMLIASLIIIVASAIFFPRSGKRSVMKESGGEKEIAVEKDPATESEIPLIVKEKTLLEYLQPLFGSGRQALFGGLVIASASLLIVGLINIMPHREHVTPFGHSMLVFLTLLWSVASGVLSFRYSEWLFKQASVREIKNRDWVLPWACAILSVVSIAAGMWLFGKYNIPAYLITDILFVLVSVGMGLLIVLLAVMVGGEDFKWKGKLRMALLGIWHAILQLIIPFLLINKGNERAFLAALLLIVVFGLIGWQLMKGNHRRLLLVVWLLFGALMIALPYLPVINDWGNQLISYKGCIGEWQTRARESLPQFASATQNSSAPLALLIKNLLSGLITLAPSLIAGIIGAILSCVWLGWYLAVSLSFNAHNNEAGGAGRIEEFKEFIRFRLTENEITGYVIAVDRPREHGSRLEPRLIDVFSLKVKGSPGD